MRRRLFCAGLGGNSDNDRERPTRDMRVGYSDGRGDDSSTNGDGSNGVDGNNNGKDGFAGNNPPEVFLLDRDGNPTDIFRVRVGMNTEFSAKADDPDGDELSCRFDINYKNGGNLFTRDWSSCDGFNYNMTSLGSYDVVARVKDSRGMEGRPYSASLEAMANVPPVVDLDSSKCPESYMGSCLFRPQINNTICWVIALDRTYDLDGSIKKFRVYPMLREFPTNYIESSDPADMCGVFVTKGIYLSRIEVIDNESAVGSIDFYNETM